MMTTTMTDEGMLERVQERQLLKAEIEKAEKRISELNNELGAELVIRGVEKVKAGEWSVSLIQQERKTLSKEGLILAGCPPHVFESPSAYSVTIVNSLRVDKRG